MPKSVKSAKLQAPKGKPKPRAPKAALIEFVQGILEALSFPQRQLLLSHLYVAGATGLRTAELARKLDKTSDYVRKHLLILEQALLIQNEVGRDQTGVYSRYTLTGLGEEWLERAQLLLDGEPILLAPETPPLD